MGNLTNFPSVYSPTIIGREDRAEYMRSQAEKYGFNLHLYPVKDYYTNRHEFKVSGPMINEGNFIPKNLHSFNYCTFISYLRCIKKWYEETEEEQVIVCDDDTDFSTSEYWHFTWQEFYDMLPPTWECIQLIAIRKDLDKVHIFPEWKEDQLKQTYIFTAGSTDPLIYQYKLIPKLPTTNIGGGVFMFKRQYVKKLLDAYTRGENEYYLDVVFNGQRLFPYPEVIAVSVGESYNFPMFVENIYLNTTYFNSEMGGDEWQKVHGNSRDFYYNYWQNNAKFVALWRMMNLDYLKRY